MDIAYLTGFHEQLIHTCFQQLKTKELIILKSPISPY